MQQFPFLDVYLLEEQLDSLQVAVFALMASKDKAYEQRLDEFTGYLASCQTQLLAYVFALVHNLADAEDICQRSSIILWEKFDQYEAGTEFRLWALKVAQYEAFNFIRRRRRERLFFSNETLSLIAETEMSEANARADDSNWSVLKQCVEKLPNRQKQLIRRYYEGGDTVAQLSLELGRSDGALRSAVCRIRKLLRDCVDRRLREEMA